MKRGFTLVELLAVIVILAIILAIAVPGVTGIVASTTKNAFASDAKMILVQLQYEKAKNADFDVTTLNKETLSNLNLSNANYESVTVSLFNNEPFIIVEGKNKWDGLTACGTYKNMKVVEGTCENNISQESSFGYTGDVQTFIVPTSGYYILQVWGAQGGGNNYYETVGGKGAYATGYSYFEKGDVLYLYVGGRGQSNSYEFDLHDDVSAGGWNGGGSGSGSGGGGGGATDIRYGGTNLSNRIIIAGGGGGELDHTALHDGSVVSYGRLNDNTNIYELGIGENCVVTRYSAEYANDEAGGGGGYYGGDTIHGDNYEDDGITAFGYGGTSSINDLEGGSILAGNSSIPDALEGTETGHSGDGYAIISYKGAKAPDLNVPVITLLGNTEIYITVGDAYVDSGATATDNVDGNITGNIITTSNVNPNVAGTYTVNYNVSDSSGNAAIQVTRTVIVYKAGFNDVYGGSDSDYFSSIANLTDGGVVVVGQTSSKDGDMTGLITTQDYDINNFIIRFDDSGKIKWKKSFGGTSEDGFADVTCDSQNCIAVGFSTSSDGDMTGLFKGGYSDAIIVKYDLDGNVVWKKTFGGSSDEFFYGITDVVDGYVAAGYSSSSDGDLSSLNKGNGDSIIVKYDFNGNVVWKKSFGGTSIDYFHDVDSASDGYIAVGHSYSTDGDMAGLHKGGYGEDAIIVKYDLNGNVIWKKDYGGTIYDQFYRVRATSDGYIAVGSSTSTNGDLSGLNIGGFDAIIVKYDLNGNVVWKKNFGGTGNSSMYSELFSDVSIVADGYVAVGDSGSSDGDLSGLNKGGGSDAIIVKYDLNGSIIWKKAFGGSDSDFFDALVSQSDGNIYAVGHSSSSNGDMAGLYKNNPDKAPDAIFIRYDASGNKYASGRQ